MKVGAPRVVFQENPIQEIGNLLEPLLTEHAVFLHLKNAPFPPCPGRGPSNKDSVGKIHLSPLEFSEALPL